MTVFNTRGGLHGGKTLRVDPDFGPSLTVSSTYVGILSQNAGSTGKLWVNTVNLRLCRNRRRRRAGTGVQSVAPILVDDL